MNRISRLRRRLAIAPVAVVAAAVVTGCGSGDPLRAGAALIIEEERISIGDLHDKVEAIEVERARFGLEPVEGEARQQIQRLIVHRIMESAAAEYGVTVTQTEIDEQISQLEGQFGGEEQFAEQVATASIAAEDLRWFIGDGILQTKLGEKLVPNATTEAELADRQNEVNEVLVAAAKDLHVVINPRYGTFDPNTGQVNAPVDPAVEDSGLSDQVDGQ